MENKHVVMSTWDYSYEQTDLGYYSEEIYDAGDYMKKYSDELKKVQYAKSADMITVDDYVNELRKNQYNNPFVTDPVENRTKGISSKKTFRKLVRGN